MDLAEIERVIRVGMCAEKRMAECGCEWCSQRLAAVEAVRALHERAERAEAEVERARGMLAARGIRVATLEEVADRWVRERDEARAEVERLRAEMGRVQYQRRPFERPDHFAERRPWHSPHCYERSGAHRDESLCTCGLTALRAQVETLTRERDHARTASEGHRTTAQAAFDTLSKIREFSRASSSRSLEALLAAATPGPWDDGEDRTEHGTSYWPRGPDGVYLMAGNHGEVQDGNDAALIVALRNVAPELLAVVRAAERVRGAPVLDSIRELGRALDALRAKLREVTG